MGVGRLGHRREACLEALHLMALPNVSEEDAVSVTDFLTHADTILPIAPRSDLIAIEVTATVTVTVIQAIEGAAH